MPDPSARIIVLAHHRGEALAPLTEHTCPALLPVGGKPLLAHTLDDVAAAGLRRATVVVGAHAEQVEAMVGDGSRWGLAVDYALVRADESERSLLHKLSAREAQELLLIHGAMLRTPCLAQVLAAARSRTGALEFEADGRALGIRLRRPGVAAQRRVTVTGRCYALRSLAEFHRASLDVAGGGFSGLLLPGREQAVGLIVGRGAKVPARCLKSGRARVGAHSRIAASAMLDGPVAIEGGCLIEAGARVRNSVILPGTYVGRMLDVRNAIVSGGDLVRIDTGATLRLEDPELLGHMHARSATGHLARAGARLGGLTLLVLSLPLWPLALLCALAEGRGCVLCRVPMRGNEPHVGRHGATAFDGFEWRTSVPLLRALPRLLAVCGGRLQLAGVSPLVEHAAGTSPQPWARHRDRAATGLLGPLVLELAPDAPAEERLIAESLFVRQPGWRRDLRYLLRGVRALFTARAWRVPAGRAGGAGTPRHATG